ncbi:MAG: MerR family DNA-binding protein [Gammaproteobacteria bacterium]|nr:MerR family DNA-binding protein [Gammaproteobacteria bacterium]
MRVIDIASKASVSPHTVRYYTKLGMLVPGVDSDNGYKVYAKSDLVRLRFITHAKSLGFTLNEIQDILSDSEQGKTPCPNVRGLLQRRIEENRQKIIELQALQKRMEDALQEWEHMPDQSPTGDVVCHLIESVSETK